MEHFSADGVTLLGHIGMLTQMRRVLKEISSFELDYQNLFPSRHCTCSIQIHLCVDG